jgi:hypothetical protein
MFCLLFVLRDKSRKADYVQIVQMHPVKSEESAKSVTSVTSVKTANAVGSAESVYNTNSRLVSMWIMKQVYTMYPYRVEIIQLISKEAASKKRRKEAVLNFQRSNRSRLGGEEDIQGNFKHFMCGECFKPLGNGVIPDKHTCKCV